MIKSFIDIGTNTALLLVARVHEDGGFDVLSEKSKIVRLGEGIDQTSEFSEAAMARTLEALREFQQELQSLGSESLRVVGTAGFRRASNAEAFVQKVQDELGFTIQIISGEREADLIALATQKDFEHVPQPYLVLDIGGGSTEFILQQDGKDRELVSLNFGVVRLTERFLKSDPLDGDEAHVLRQWTRKQLASLKFSAKPQALVATAGTPTTTSALIQKLETYDSQKVHGSQFTRDQLKELIARLATLTLEERAQIPCLPAKRADVILAGLLILDEVMAHFNFSSSWVSDRGLRYGLLHSSRIQ